jgi:hypothetical protein
MAICLANASFGTSKFQRITETWLQGENRSSTSGNGDGAINPEETADGDLSVGSPVGEVPFLLLIALGSFYVMGKSCRRKARWVVLRSSGTDFIGASR